MDHTSSAAACESSESSTPQNEWRKISSSVCRETRNAVMIAIISAVYEHLLSLIFELQCNSSQSRESSECPSSSACSEEQDDVYFRFGGGALADMFQTRYKQMKSSKSQTVKAKICEELSVLQWMKMEDGEKATLPESLKYRDRGHMYFPHRHLLPFIRKFDEAVRMSANADTFRKEGSKMIKVCI